MCCRYTLTYTPSQDCILPSPSELHVKIKNTSAIVLRGAYLHGPYTLYAATYPSTFDPNYKHKNPEQHGTPDFEPNLKAGGSWASYLKVPESIRENASKANVKRTTDGAIPSFTWIIEVSSQVIFSVTATVNFEILVGRDEKSVELGFSALTGQAVPTPGQLQDHQQGKGKGRLNAAQPKGVFSKAINLVVDDTASLWNKPALPEWDDEGKDRGKKPNTQAQNEENAPAPGRISRAIVTGEESPREKPKDKRQKKVHLVVLTHGLHSNLGADMLYLKESIDVAAKEAREDTRKRKAKLRSSEKSSSARKQEITTQSQASDEDHGASTAPLSGGQDDLHSNEDDGHEDDEEEVIVRGFSGNAVRTERGIQYLGKRLAKYVLAMTYPDQPFLPVRKSMTQSLTRAFTGSQPSEMHAGLPAHKNSSIHKGAKRRTDSAYRITSISFIAHSLGGLTQTYAIAYIHKHSPHFFEEIKPLNFVTMASPILGLSNENPVYVKFALDFGLVGRTGQDLGLTWRAPTMVRSGWGAMIGGIGAEGQRAHKNPDPGAKPLLRVLPTGPAHQVLKLFRNRTVYSNVVNDGIVPLRTSCLLFLDWSGLGRVEKARRENGLIGTVAGWGWAEMTGGSSRERRQRAMDSGTESQVESGEERSRSNSRTRQSRATVPQPADDATREDTATQEQENPETHRAVDNRAQHNQDEDYDATKSKDEAPAQPQHPLAGVFNFLRPNQNKSDHRSPKQTRIYKRSQTIRTDSGHGAKSSEDIATPHRPGMARGGSILDDPSNVFAPPKTTFFESAGDILNPPLPTEEFLIDPSSRPRTIFHDRIYHPEDIPPPPEKKRSGTKRTFSSDSSKNSLTRSNTDYGVAGPQSSADIGGMKVEEKIARAYHRELSWRKVLVRLEPDAHNNICVRRMFSNAYGWPVIKHLVDTHFSSDYAAVTADEHEPSVERAKPVTEPVGEHGEEVKDDIRTGVPRTNSEMHESTDELTNLESPKQQTSMNSSTGGRQRLNRQDSVLWDDAMFEVTDDDDDDEIESPVETRTRRQLLETPAPGANHQQTRTTDADITDFLNAGPETLPEGLELPRKPDAVAQPVISSQPEKVQEMSATPSGGTAGVGLGKSVEEQMRIGAVRNGEEEGVRGILKDMTKMSMSTKEH